MKTIKLVNKLEGIQTIKSISSLLGINKKKAIYYVFRLRKKGYVKTKRTKDKTRVYSISKEHKAGGESYYEIINQNSPIKIAARHTHKVYGKKISLEEALIFAIKTRDLRTILAALALFKKINNWKELYELAKKNKLKREVGALYSLARKIMKTKKITKRFMTLSLPKKEDKYKYIIQGMKSKDFKEIEKEWKIYLPFNMADMEEYK